MPELPDVTVYVDGLKARVVGRPIERVRVFGPFLVRSVDPPVEAAEGRRVLDVRRLGKRIVLALDGDLFLVFHLMIAGRFRWEARSSSDSAEQVRARGRPSKIVLALFDFATGRLLLTEAGTKKRASLHLVRGAEALAAHDPGGLEVMEADQASFRAVLLLESHTLKRALTDPRLFSGIGKAYSDEILHRARLSPVKLTSKLTEDEIGRLFAAVRDTLGRWIEVLREEFRDRFPGPGEITAFRPGFAVHGRYGKPCPACGAKVQRIRYADHETNYCPKCQTDGRLLADRSLSRLLKDDWPRTVEELESGGGV